MTPSGERFIDAAARALAEHFGTAAALVVGGAGAPAPAAPKAGYLSRCYERAQVAHLRVRRVSDEGWRVASQSEADLWHAVTWAASGHETTCDCQGFERFGFCVHLASVDLTLRAETAIREHLAYMASQAAPAQAQQQAPRPAPVAA